MKRKWKIDILYMQLKNSSLSSLSNINIKKYRRMANDQYIKDVNRIQIKRSQKKKAKS